MITLFQFPRLLGVPNMSPFCLKLEAWLRMVELKYDIREITDPRKGPKGKLPYIRDNDTTVADSALAIDHLKKAYKVQIDSHLSLADQAISRGFDKMLEEHLYWALIYNRWIDDNWTKVREACFCTLPALVRTFVPALAQKNMKDALDGNGIGRHSRDEIYEMANKDLKAISDFLADKPYLMGDKPSSIDATLFAFLCNIINVPLRSPMKDYAHKSNNLMRYNERMGQQLFPEFFKDEEGDEAWLTEH